MQMDDLEYVLEIDRLSFSLPWPASAYHYELNENPRSLLYVAEAAQPDGNGRVVGMVVVWMVLDEGHIANIAVHPEYRSRGIGRRLLVTALQEAIQKGARQATLEVRLSNIAAQNLYRQFGFDVAGSRPHYYRDNNEDALIMTANNLGETYSNWLRNHRGDEGGQPWR
jgi:ribosomal-protein-alanine N-acetyltransferase